MSIKPHIRSRSIAVRNVQARHGIYGTKLIEVYTEQGIRTMDELLIVLKICSIFWVITLMLTFVTAYCIARNEWESGKG